MIIFILLIISLLENVSNVGKKRRDPGNETLQLLLVFRRTFDTFWKFQYQDIKLTLILCIWTIPTNHISQCRMSWFWCTLLRSKMWFPPDNQLEKWPRDHFGQFLAYTIKSMMTVYELYIVFEELRNSKSQNKRDKQSNRTWIYHHGK